MHAWHGMSYKIDGLACMHNVTIIILLNDVKWLQEDCELVCDEMPPRWMYICMREEKENKMNKQG